MLGHSDRSKRVVNDLSCLQVLVGDDHLRKVTVGPLRLGSRSMSDHNMGTLCFGEFLSLSTFGEVFLLDGACSPPPEGCDLDNSGRVERGLRARRGDRATKWSYSGPKCQYNTSEAHPGRNLRATAALNIVVGVERNSGRVHR